MKSSVYNNKLDLLIVDIDDTFIYHRTVAAANKIFLSLFGIYPKKLCTTRRTILYLLNVFNYRKFEFFKIVKLGSVALYLHMLNFLREINNRMFKVKSCEKIVKLYAKTIAKLGIKAEDYLISSEVIKENIDKKVLSVYNSLDKTKVLAITQSFSVGEDPIKTILGLDFIESNSFVVKDGKINDFDIKIKDKLEIAKKYVKKGMNVGLILDDYDDLSLLKLSNIKFIMYKKNLERFIGKRRDIITISFR